MNPRASLATRREYCLLGNLFVAWLEETRAGVKTWADLTVKILQGYVRHCQETLRLSHDQTRKRLYVIKATSRYLADTYGFADVARVVWLKRSQENPLEASARESRKAFPAEDLMVFLGLLREQRPPLYPVACLQGLCGLRVLEAVNLREQDIDFAKGTVTVTETPFHKPKNRSSHRSIPVSAMVLSILREWIDGLKVRRDDGVLFATDRGNAPWSVSGYCHAMRRAISSAWRDSGLESLRHFKGHWLRATFVSLVRSRRADFRLLQADIGHAPSDVLGRHYEVIDTAVLRDEIVSRMAQIWHESGPARNTESI